MFDGREESYRSWIFLKASVLILAEKSTEGFHHVKAVFYRPL